MRHRHRFTLMKKHFILGLLAVAAMASCKKNRTCVCGASENRSPVFEVKDTKRNAKDKCAKYEADMKSNPLIDLAPGYGCEIK